MYHLNDKFVLAEIECHVAFIDGANNAYLTPEVDGDYYNNSRTYVGCVFAKINPKGKDGLGNKAIAISNKECGAV